MSLLAKISDHRDERSARLAGIGLMLLSIFMFSFGDALGKYMVATYAVGQLLWLRACAALLVLSPLIWRSRRQFLGMERPRLRRLGVTQPRGDNTAPSRNVPANCDDASTISGVARSERVISIKSAKDRLPPSAIMAGQLTVCAEGRSAIRTPPKPIRIALQRRQPTRSRKTIADSAVTNTGQAR